MSIPLSSFSKSGFKKITIFNAIFTTLLFSFIFIMKINDINHEKIIINEIDQNKIIKEATLNKYNLKNDSINTTIEIPIALNNEFIIVYNTLSREYLAKPKFYPYSEFDGLFFLILVYIGIFIAYKVRMKSDKP
jgi:hypothetical protein